MAVPYLIEIGVLRHPLTVWESLLNVFGMLAENSVLDRMYDALLHSLAAQTTVLSILVGGAIVSRLYMYLKN